jgi:hypothetical protein
VSAALDAGEDGVMAVSEETAMDSERDDWPEGSLRDGGSVYYGHPVHPAALADLRRACRRLVADGALAILVGRERDDPPVPGYPGWYLTVRAVMTEEDW